MRSLVLASLLLPTLALAQVPKFLGYQGRLLKADGSAEVGVVQMNFGIYGDQTGGQALWTEAQNVAVSEGFYSAQLGSVTSFPQSLFDGSDRFLEVSINGIALTPRQRIGSVPYAVHCGGAVNVQGGVVEATSVKVNGQAVTNSSGKVDLAALSGCPTAGDILKWQNGAWACTPDAGGLASIAVSAPLSGDGTQGAPIGLKAAGASSDGYLKSSDFAAFTAKVASVSAGPGITIGGTASDPTVAVTSQGCADGDVLKWNGSAWSCQPGFELTPGAGIGVTGSPYSPTLSVKFGTESGTAAEGNHTHEMTRPNLAHNGAIERFTAGPKAAPNWFAAQTSFNVTNSGISRVAGYDGAYAVSLLDADFGSKVVIKQVIYAAGSPNIANKTFSASVRYTKAAGVGIKGRLCLADAGADNAETSMTCADLDGNDTWKLGAVTHKTSADPKYLKVLLTPTGAANAEAAEYIFDNLFVVNGPPESFFMPNHEDALAGMVAMFESACPAGWEEVEGLRNKFPRGWNGSAALQAGGSDDAVVVSHAHGNSFALAAVGDHNHAFSASTNTTGGHGHCINVSGADDNNHTGNFDGVADSDAGNKGCIRNTAGAGDHAHSVSGTSGNGGGHNHTFSGAVSTAGQSGVGANVPAYLTFVYCRRM